MTDRDGKALFRRASTAADMNGYVNGGVTRVLVLEGWEGKEGRHAQLTCLAASTGQELWRRRLPAVARGGQPDLLRRGASCAVSPDGSRVAIVIPTAGPARPGAAFLLDGATGKDVAALGGAVNWVHGFTPDGSCLLGWGGKDGDELLAWGAVSGRARFARAGFRGFWPDCGARHSHLLLMRRHVSTGKMARGVLRVVGLERGETLFRLEGAPTTAAALSPDGELLVSAHVPEGPGSSQEVAVWRVGSGEKLFCLRGHSAPVASALFSPDVGRVVTATSGGDPELRFWDVRSGREVLHLKVEVVTTPWFGFTADGTRLLMLGFRGVIDTDIGTGPLRYRRVWDACPVGR